ADQGRRGGEDDPVETAVQTGAGAAAGVADEVERPTIDAARQGRERQGGRAAGGGGGGVAGLDGGLSGADHDRPDLHRREQRRQGAVGGVGQVVERAALERDSRRGRDAAGQVDGRGGGVAVVVQAEGGARVDQE